MKINNIYQSIYRNGSNFLHFLIFILVFFTNGTVLTAQNNTNKEIQDITKIVLDKGWIEFKKEKQVNPITIFENYKSAFGLGNNDIMQFVKVKNDDIGYSHYRYQQYYKGYKIEGAEYIIHAKDGIVIKANGKIVEGLTINVIPIISEVEALNFAKNEINATEYMWETENKYYPKAQLVILSKSLKFSFNPDSFCLAYKFNIYSKEPFGSYWVYVDAHNGTVVKKESSIYYCSTGTCVTSYYGSRNFTTKYRGWPNDDYILKDECRGGGIHTKIGLSNIDDGDNQWSLPEERPATTTHWAMQMTFDYFLNTFSRSSFDGNSAEIICKAKNNFKGPFNAFYYNADFDDNPNDDFFAFGEANGDDGFNSIDVVAHEFMHGVINFEAKLNDSGEPGNLGESFGDIFGEMVELYTLGSNDYISGSEIPSNPYSRSLISPKDNGHPNTYQGQYWASGNDHFRAGVQNYWFYLLSEGGSGFVDDDSNNEPYNVIGIGSASAARIAYRSVCSYLSSSSNYADAKNGSIWAAMELFGECSNEVVQTIAAWNAVGVYSGISNDYTVSCPIDDWVHYSLGSITMVGQTPPYNCTMMNGHYYILAAGNSIRVTSQYLQPGQRIIAQNGSYFHAYINPCLENNLRLINPNVNSENNIDSKASNSNDVENKNLTNENILSHDIKFNIYPNPSNGMFVISVIGQKAPYSIEITNFLGNVLFKKENLLDNTLQQDFSEFAKGIYFARLTVGNKQFNKKIVLQ